MTSVYLLADPDDLLHVRYVGIANDPLKRFNCHVSSVSGRKSRVRSWVASLKSRGELPIMIVLARVARGEACDLEREYISKFKAAGHDLVNVSSGGEHSGFGVRCSEETRAKISAANLGRKMTVESRRRVSEGARRRCENDPGLARRVAIATYAADPSIRERQSRSQLARFKRPKERDKARAAALARSASPAYRAARSVISKRIWTEQRAVMLAAARSPQRRAKISASKTQYWQRRRRA